MDNLRFELDTVSNKETGVLAVADYESTLLLARKILDANPVFEIANDADKKKAKDLRADINKIIKEIDRRRIDTIADFTTQFSEQCNSIKELFATREKELKEVITAYEESVKLASVDAAPTTKFVATLKFTDPKVVDKLTKFAQTNGCELTIK